MGRRLKVIELACKKVLDKKVDEKNITKSEMIERIYEAQDKSGGSLLTGKDIELAVKIVLEQMTSSLASGKRIEIRGFGSFSLRYREPRLGRNPKTGESVGLAGKYVPHFKPGKILREKVDRGSRD